MRLVTHIYKGTEQLALLNHNKLYNLHSIDPSFPHTMKAFLAEWDMFIDKAKEADQHCKEGKYPSDISFDQANLMAPVPYPSSCRDGYAFRQHVAAARRNRKVDMIAEFDQYPIFYFTNHQAIQGPGDVFCMPDHFQKLDFELEAAIVVAKRDGISQQLRQINILVAI
jgi:fumarylacetoacetate (FAA) hydrolase